MDAKVRNGNGKIAACCRFVSIPYFITGLFDHFKKTLSRTPQVIGQRKTINCSQFSSLAAFCGSRAVARSSRKSSRRHFIRTADAPVRVLPHRLDIRGRACNNGLLLIYVRAQVTRTSAWIALSARYDALKNFKPVVVPLSSSDARIPAA